MGKQEANIYEIAREAGVSIATVSRVINHSNAVSEKSYRRVMDAVRKFNYVPNSTARSLSTSTSTSIGVVIPDINNPFFSLLLEGITRVADERGYHVLLFNTAENTDREHQVLQTMREHRLRGIIITPVSEQDPDTMKRLHNFETLGIPVVLLDREVDSQFFDRVVTDDERGVYAAISELIRVGHRRIAIITGPDTSSSAEARLHGYMDALRAHGLPLRQEYILHGDFKTELAYTLTKRLFEEGTPVTAVFACNSSMSRGCMLALAERGRVIGRDVSFISCGRLEGMGERISSVLYPTQAIGAECANILLDRIAHRGGQRTAKRRVVFDMQLMLRGSESLCGTP